MEHIFIPTPTFEKSYKRLKKKYYSLKKTSKIEISALSDRAYETALKELLENYSRYPKQE